MLELEELGYNTNERTTIAGAGVVSFPEPEPEDKPTDIDVYHILVKFLLHPTRMDFNKLRVWPLKPISTLMS